MMNRANEILNNWTPEVASLIATLKRHKFEIVKGNNGEESFKFDGDMKKFIANLTATDEAHLYVKCPKSGKVRWIFLVFGNSPGELASDYSIPVELTTDEDPMNKATEEHYTRWENRKQPTHTAAEAYPETYGPKARLEYLRGELRAERISTGELIELQSLVLHIEAGDVELLEAAGVPEMVFKCQKCGTELPAHYGHETALWRHCTCGHVATRK